MGKTVAVSGLMWLLAVPAEAWVAHGRISSCVVTIGAFCPLESIGGTLLGVGVLAGLGLGVSWLFRR